MSLNSNPSKHWWQNRFITLMVIPDRTHRVHKVVVPFLIVKLGMVLVSLAAVFLLVVGMDYIHVLSRISENKALKGENFRLRQEMQQIRNKVDSMESTIERVQNYAKKLQMLTGQSGKVKNELPSGLLDEAPLRAPASKDEKRSQVFEPAQRFSEAPPTVANVAFSSGKTLDERVDSLEKIILETEGSISRLQVGLLAQRSVMDATPSLIPIAGWVSSSFGYRRNPYDGSFKLHAGVDIAAEPGTPVRAPADGQIIFSGYREGYGKVIVIDHGYGIHTVYAHNSKLFTSNGNRVKRGEMISQVGSTGHSTGPHLHYEIRKNGVPVNPALFFSRSRF